MKIHSPMDAVELSRIRAIGEKVQQLQKEGRDIVRLQIGEPDFTTPGHIIAAAKAAMDHGQTHYAPNRGLASLREEISRKLLRDNGITADPATETLVTSGCAEGLYLVFMGLVEPGDEVIILEPAYISYLQLARAAHARAVPVHAKEENGWLPDLDELRAAVTPKTKLLVLNTPGNPTGVVYPREVLQQIAALAQEQDFLVLSDEVYEKLIYDGAQHRIHRLSGWHEGAYHHHQRLFQGICHDRLADGLSGGRCQADSSHAEGPPIRRCQLQYHCPERSHHRAAGGRELCGGNAAGIRPQTAVFAGCLCTDSGNLVCGAGRYILRASIPIFPAPGCPARTLPTSS